MLKAIPDVVDVSIDDFEGVYRSVPWERVRRDGGDTNKQAFLVHDTLVGLREHGAASLERESFAQQLGETIGGKLPATKRAALLAAALSAFERFIASPDFTASPPAECLQLFYVQAVYRGVKGSLERLESLMKAGTAALAWGNTNTRLADMRPAVELARKHGYDVVFVPLVGIALDELLQRNFKRFWQTGKYVPVEAVAATRERVERLLAQPMTLDRVVGAGRDDASAGRDEEGTESQAGPAQRPAHKRGQSPPAPEPLAPEPEPLAPEPSPQALSVAPRTESLLQTVWEEKNAAPIVAWGPPVPTGLPAAPPPPPHTLIWAPVLQHPLPPAPPPPFFPAMLLWPAPVPAPFTIFGAPHLPPPPPWLAHTMWPAQQQPIMFWPPPFVTGHWSS